MKGCDVLRLHTAKRNITFPSLQGIGRKVLEKQGWEEGKGLGGSKTGITEALDNDGQNPRDRSGLG